MTLDDFGKIIKIVETKLGLKPHSMSLMIWKDRIQERMLACQLDNNEEYVQVLQTSPQELQELIELMINSETWFFREKRDFDYLSQRIVRSEAARSFLRILCLACSSGEEPYSIAIALYERGLSKNDFQIDAIDISQRALDLAQIGEYREKSFRSNDMHFREQAFDPTPTGWMIKNQIKKQVHFYHGNIIEKELRFDFHAYQVIFCRNLLIYLNQTAQNEVLNYIKSLLDREGILFVSSAETEIVRKSGFEPILFQGAHAFKLRLKDK